MTPERALEHDGRCEKYYAWQLDGAMICRCSERALAASRQREEEAKAKIKDHLDEIAFARRQCAECRAENDRLTLAASESARTVQVEIERLRVWMSALKEQVATLRQQYANSQRTVGEVTRAFEDQENQVTALREALDHARGVFAYYGKAFGYEACTGMVKKIDAALAALPQDGA